jgi:hypothetical protein
VDEEACSDILAYEQCDFFDEYVDEEYGMDEKEVSECGTEISFSARL